MHAFKLCSSQECLSAFGAESGHLLRARSEAIWQRCWASASDSKLRIGAIWGAAQVLFLFAPLILPMHRRQQMIISHEDKRRVFHLINFLRSLHT